MEMEKEMFDCVCRLSQLRAELLSAFWSPGYRLTKALTQNMKLRNNCFIHHIIKLWNI